MEDFDFNQEEETIEEIQRKNKAGHHIRNACCLML